jgi:D-alanyl-lipoteichoic acid acyltransferase DltB (MBOAT superfamily)
MLFNSLQFCLFFAIVTSLYFVLPHRLRWGLLLAASCYFYMVFVPVYILILALIIVIDYVAGILIERAEGKTRKYFLIASLLANIGVLFVFKYFNFVADSITDVVSLVSQQPVPNIALRIILPIGLSFHTFQSMSYTIEVYRGHQKAERHFGIYALYVMFYPQLVAGPIERPQNLLHQFRERHDFDYQRVTDGLKLMAWGMFKKVVIADRLAVFVNEIYQSPQNYEGWSLIIGTVFFAFQIYCDFSGYSDIAIGSAQVMGIKLMQNFRRPYFATSIADFWTRWHVSLSTWFRDYLYIPLGGNRVPQWRWWSNLLIVFLISGLWHGANWTFVIWGALNGFYLIGEIWTRNIRSRISGVLRLERIPLVQKALQMIITFALVSFAWIFFRANNLSDAFYIISHAWIGYGRLGLIDSLKQLGTSIDIGVALGAIICLLLVESFQSQRSVRSTLAAQPVAIRWLAYYILVMAILIFAQITNPIEFNYFQF